MDGLLPHPTACPQAAENGRYDSGQGFDNDVVIFDIFHAFNVYIFSICL